MSSTSSFSCYPIYKKKAHFLEVICSYLFELSRCFSVCMSGHGCVTLASTWVGVVVVFMLLDVSFFQKRCVPILSTVKSIIIIKKRRIVQETQKAKKKKSCVSVASIKLSFCRICGVPALGGRREKMSIKKKKKERERIERSNLRREEKKLCFVCLFVYLFV